MKNVIYLIVMNEQWSLRKLSSKKIIDDGFFGKT